MKAHISIEANIREEVGKGAARAARRNKQIPAIVYSKDKSPVSITLPENVLSREYFGGGFMSSIVEIKTNKETMYALPREVQLHPVKDSIMHVDFLAVNQGSEIRVLIPVKFKNRERSKGLKRGGVLNVVRFDLELLCTPETIPGVIEIDLLDYNIGDSVHVSNIDLPEGVRPVIQDRDFTIAAIVGKGKKAEEDEDAATTSAVSGAVEGAEAAGEKKAEGEKKEEKK